MSDAQKGQICMRVRRTHERPGVARWPRLTIGQQYVRSESKNNGNKKIDKKQLKLRASTKLEFLRDSVSVMGSKTKRCASAQLRD